MPKILILVLSYNNGVYGELMKTQQQTWDSIEVEGVRTVYYHGWVNPNPLFISAPSNIYQPAVIRRNENHSWVQLGFNCTDEYYYMSKKFQMALEYVKDWDYDIIFRSNSSSYISKQRLKEFAETLPKEKLYAGWTMVDSEDHSGLAVSGAGIWLSRDCAEILREQIDPNFEMEEDVYCSRILRKHGIVAIDDKSRYDVPVEVPEDIPLDRFHYRLKSGAPRSVDVDNMRKIHSLIVE